MYIEDMTYNALGLELRIRATAGAEDAEKLADAFRNAPRWRWAEFGAGIPVKADDFAALIIGKGSDAISAISRVIFAPPATIVFWADGTKTVVKAENEPFDAEKGFAMAVAKKFLTSKDYHRIMASAKDYRESVCIDNAGQTRRKDE